jgi:hypothetical protein
VATASAVAVALAPLPVAIALLLLLACAVNVSICPTIALPKVPIGTFALALTVAFALAVAFAVGVVEPAAGPEPAAVTAAEPFVLVAAEPTSLALASPVPAALADAELPSPVAVASAAFEVFAETDGAPSSPIRAAASVALVALAAALPLEPTVAVAVAWLTAET